MTFKEFDLDRSLQDGLEAMGFDKPTPIQEQAIPIILKGKDLIACAQTGTGKTAAYLLPVINHILHREGDSIDAIIVVPTRELAVQIDQQLEGFSYFTPISSIAIYGGGDGSSFDREKAALKQGADIIIATPGRLISHLNLGYVAVEALQHLILDEADRMLDMGFQDDILKIISHLPQDRQTLLFSATMPPKIRQLANKILKDSEEITIAVSKPAEGVFHAAFSVYEEQKLELIRHLVGAKELPSIIIFSSTKMNVKAIQKELQKMNLSADAIHSDLEQHEREEVLRDFRNRELQILVATDILSRGIDIEGISLVINYDVPNDAEDYIHRIGRTARAATKGVAFTFINKADQQKFKRIEDLIGTEIRKVKLPPHIGEGPIYSPMKKNRGKRKFNKKNFKKKKRS
ncbi:DEAD/DEAH box helicase [Fulvivirgaceae bacterium BMA10]|uniref:DEAD/DEAH box helicase n=1 Tax=Splendidivirga corallicola TaxID=3051826 RepID=A0ABT8KPI4_9BACT|nr:DEAD/DEAH box helicase [Fulvivirgaceae bacterium BMA10]